VRDDFCDREERASLSKIITRYGALVARVVSARSPCRPFTKKAALLASSLLRPARPLPILARTLELAGLSGFRGCFCQMQGSGNGGKLSGSD
jgi:hypothetical protein